MLLVLIFSIAFVKVPSRTCAAFQERLWKKSKCIPKGSSEPLNPIYAIKSQAEAGVPPFSDGPEGDARLEAPWSCLLEGEDEQLQIWLNSTEPWRPSCLDLVLAT